MITAFASEYMQESSDGCEISRTYLQLISTIQYIQDLTVEEYSAHTTNTEYMDICEIDNQDTASNASMFSNQIKQGGAISPRGNMMD